MFDFEALLKQFNVPNVDAKSIMEAQQKNIEALVAANQKIAESMQKIAEREQEIIQSTFNDWSHVAGDFNSDGDFQERSARQTEVAIKAVEEGIRNLRTLADLVSKAQTDSMEILNKRMDEGIRELRQQVAKPSRSSVKSKR
jgi:phasin family protein